MSGKQEPERYCAHCSAQLTRNRINERLEDMGVFKKRKYCNRACMAAGMVKENPSRKGFGIRARKFRQHECAQCGARENLSIHHRDRKWENNDPVNLETLCSSCHTSLHHAAGEINPKQEKPPCRYCGTPSYRNGVCNTCRTRIRRRGTPYFGRIEYLDSLRQADA